MRGSMVCRAVVLHAVWIGSVAFGVSFSLIGMPVVANELLEVFPASPLASTGGTWSGTETEGFSSSGSSWALTHSESNVFSVRMQHTQKNSSGGTITNRSWDLRIGKAGQIYSLRSAFGEATAPQWRNPNGVDGANFAPWMDEVFQLVLTDRTQNDPDNDHYYMIHQAGVYLRGDAVLEARSDNNDAFYSPQLARGAGTESHSRVFVSWGQQSHQPSIFTSDCIFYTKYRNPGAGILEVTYMVYNYGTNTIDMINAPWGGSRRTTLGTHYYTDASANMIQTNGGNFLDGSFVLLRDTAGWFVYASGTNTAANSLAIVTGTDPHAGKSWQTQASRWRYGNATTEPTGNETDWRNLFVSSAIRYVQLAPGGSMFFRIYFVAGTRTAVSGLIDTYGLVSKADYGPVAFTAASSPQLNWYVDANGEPTRAAQSGQTPFKTTYAHPVPGKKPVFYLRNPANGQRIYTTNPYQLSGSPYDYQTEYKGFLGYEYP
jgi:hypothetical protein